jgi:diguanylate cyclase (GGDEF)-like protein/PAS domain S-box-containing protein
VRCAPTCTDPVTELDQLPCPVVLTSASGRVVQVNAELARVAGGEPGHWLGQQIDALMPPASRIFLQTHVWPMLYREGSVREIHLYLRGAQGQRMPVMVNCDRRDGADGPNYLWVLFVANQRSQFEAELLAARQRADQAIAELQLAHSAVNNTAEGIAVTDATGVVLSVNPALQTITGYGAAELIGHKLQTLQKDPDDAAQRASVEKALAASGAHRGEVWVRRKDGEPFPAWQTVTRIPPSAGVPERRVVVVHDITERQRDDERLRHLAFHDPLTDLPNRALLLDRLNQLLVRTEREGRSLAVLYLDLDGFKGVNDSLGHAAGDELLRETARRLLQLVRRSDTVARMGGDEFVILIDNPSHSSEVELVAQRVIEALGTPFVLRHATVGISTSVGITWARQQWVNGEHLMHRADQALYAAKLSGKNTYRFADT